MADKPFCVHPFLRHYVGTHGSTELCCESRGRHTGDSASWRAPHLDRARQQWRRHEWPSECGGCRETESQGGVSLRQRTNRRWPREHRYLAENPTRPLPDPKAYDLRLNRTCNLACATCGPSLSSLHHALRGGGDTQDHTSEMVTEIMANSHNTQHLALAGGEPFLMPGVDRVLSHMVSTGHASHCDVEITTNGTVIRPQWLDDWLPRFRSARISVSCDAVADRAEYVRWPMRWPRWADNMDLLLEWRSRHPRAEVTLGCTVSAMTLRALPDLWEYHTLHRVDCDYDSVTTPEWLAPQQATEAIKRATLQWIQSLPPDRAHATGLITNVLPRLHMPGRQDHHIHQQQREGIGYLNSHRPIRWREAIPELAHWDDQP